MNRFFRGVAYSPPAESSMEQQQSSLSESPKEGLIIRAESRLSNTMGLEVEFSKKEYLKCQQEYRRQFLHRYFRESLEIIFDNLKKNALNGKKCAVELEFPSPDLMDIDKLEQVLKDYFSFLDYTCIPAPRKEDHDGIIRLTLS